MKRLLAALILTTAAIWATETPVLYQVTHIAKDEVGFRCLGHGTMNTHNVADMLIVTCEPAKESK